MTLFEYLAVAFSLVFSFTAARLVAGLPYALKPERRYFVHVLQVGNLLLTVVVTFWAFWSFRNVEWNLARFVSALAGPGLLYFLACTLIPEAPEGVASWRQHFYSVRRSFFTGVAAWTCIIAVNSTISLGIPIWHPVRATQFALLSIAAVGAVSESPKVHAILAISSLALLLAFVALSFLPDSLTA